MVVLAATRTVAAAMDTIVQSQIVAIVGSMAHSLTNRRRRRPDTRNELKNLALPGRGSPRGVIAVGVHACRVPLLYGDALLARVGHRGLVHGHDHDHDYDHGRGRGRVPAHGDTVAGDHRALSRARDCP